MVFGGDYDTPDAICLRDYVHVVDLARKARGGAENITWRTGVFRWILGFGKGSSVLEVLRSFEKAVGQQGVHVSLVVDGRQSDDRSL
ncbi:hypothetical protein GCM10007170_46720 [Arthrobacter liuii]|uniref:UDP-glucose 4-epimerase n=1 Tax=Arthrobacter liuii TaxID=1476996 RepID=A0ABQ2B3D2_9MICC|nr:hypothetical protein GCM10007170_46720 [Arthrobacter liuii]